MYQNNQPASDNTQPSDQQKTAPKNGLFFGENFDDHAFGFLDDETFFQVCHSALNKDVLDCQQKIMTGLNPLIYSRLQTSLQKLAQEYAKKKSEVSEKLTSRQSERLKEKEEVPEVCSDEYRTGSKENLLLQIDIEYQLKQMAEMQSYTDMHPRMIIEEMGKRAQFQRRTEEERMRIAKRDPNVINDALNRMKMRQRAMIQDTLDAIRPEPKQSVAQKESQPQTVQAAKPLRLDIERRNGSERSSIPSPTSPSCAAFSSAMTQTGIGRIAPNPGTTATSAAESKSQKEVAINLRIPCINRDTTFRVKVDQNVLARGTKVNISHNGNRFQVDLPPLSAQPNLTLTIPQHSVTPTNLMVRRR